MKIGGFLDEEDVAFDPYFGIGLSTKAVSALGPHLVEQIGKANERIRELQRQLIEAKTKTDDDKEGDGDGERLR